MNGITFVLRAEKRRVGQDREGIPVDGGQFLRDSLNHRGYLVESR